MTVGGIIQQIYDSTVSSVIFVYAFIGLLVVAVVLAIAYYLYAYTRPRLVAPCQGGSSFDDGAAVVYKRIVANMSRLRLDSSSSSSSSSSDPKLATLVADVAALDGLGVTVDDFNFYFQFHELLVGKGTPTVFWFFTQFDKNVVARMAPPKVLAALCPGGRVDEDRLNQYRFREFAAMAKFHNDVAQASAAMGPLDAMPDGGQLAPWLAVHDLDVIFSQYSASLIRGYNLRRARGFAFQLSLLKVYLSEFAHHVFIEKIKEEIWGAFMARIAAVKKKTTELYEELVGSLTDLLDEMINEKREGFGALFEIFMLPLKILTLLFKMFQKIADFFDDPLGFIVWIVTVILIFLLLVSVTIFGAIFMNVALVPFSFGVAFVISTVLTVFWLITFFFVFSVLIVVTVLDYVTAGHVMMLFRCENALDAWITAPGFGKGNVYERALLCLRPCNGSFDPHGLLCLKSQDPEFCPQQYIFSKCSIGPAIYAYEGADHALSPVVQTFSPGVDYWAADEKGKVEIVRAFYAKIHRYVQGCESAYKAFDRLPRSMCANLATLQVKDRVIEKLCAQTYCEFAEVKASFCAALEVQDVVVSNAPVKDDDGSDDAVIVTRTLVAAATFAVACAVLVTLYVKFKVRAPSSSSPLDELADALVAS